jgi:hypothetical protein
MSKSQLRAIPVRTHAGSRSKYRNPRIGLSCSGDTRHLEYTFLESAVLEDETPLPAERYHGSCSLPHIGSLIGATLVFTWALCTVPVGLSQAPSVTLVPVLHSTSCEVTDGGRAAWQELCTNTVPVVHRSVRENSDDVLVDESEHLHRISQAHADRRMSSSPERALTLHGGG